MFKIKSIPLLVIGSLLFTAILLFILLYVKNGDAITAFGRLMNETTSSPKKVGRITIVVLTVILASLGGIFITKSTSKSALFLVPVAIAAVLFLIIGKYSINEPMDGIVPFVVFALGSYILASVWELFVIMKREEYPGFLIMGFVGAALLITGIILLSSFARTTKSGSFKIITFLDILPFVLIAFSLLYIFVGWIKGIGYFLLFTVGLVLAVVARPLFNAIRNLLDPSSANEDVYYEDE